jgi:hypothetical protein
LKRSGEIQMMQQQMAAMEAEIKRLSGDLQTSSREAIHANKQMEVMKTEMKLKEFEIRSKMATELYEARLVDEVGLAKIERKNKAKVTRKAK